MRQLILCAALAVTCVSGGVRADTLDTLNASQVATRQLDACFDQNFRPGQDKSTDKGASKRRLLDACSAQWDTASETCHANSGKPLQDCRKQTGALADDYLSLKDAGVQ